ncbi:MAG: DUF1080 domain-containing protein [Planctomycetia bacterium]|nr:DUF1080 domain-containing protein [Planctomycetia bacterium]
MKRRILSLVLCLVVLDVCLAYADDPAPQTPKETRELFNGHSLEGWYTFIKDRGVNDDPKGVFTVTDGMIHITGEEFGCITTEEAFCDYRIIVEYKWGEKRWPPRQSCTRDSGLLVHSVGADGAFGGTWLYSIEANIIEGGVGDFIVVGDGSDQFSITVETAPEQSPQGQFIWQQGGKAETINQGRVDWFARDPKWSDTADFRGQNDVDLPHGQWNTLEVVAEGDTLDVFVNGTLVNQASKVRPSSGRIQIQSEAAEIFIRRITLAPLSK